MNIRRAALLFREIRIAQIAGIRVLHVLRSTRRMEPLIIPIRDRRLIFAERMDLFGHAVAAVGLLTRCPAEHARPGLSG